MLSTEKFCSGFVNYSIPVAKLCCSKEPILFTTWQNSVDSAMKNYFFLARQRLRTPEQSDDSETIIQVFKSRDLDHRFPNHISNPLVPSISSQRLSILLLVI